jgi:choline kinase
MAGRAAIDKAVVLAAGLGNRISAVAQNTPKPLLPLDGKAGGPTFLDWHVEHLAAVGVREIYLVGNKVTFGTKLRAAPPRSGRPVTWILNPTEDLSTSGSGHSAWYAWGSEHGILDGKSRVVLMDADVLYEPSLLALLAGAEGPRSKTLICSDFRHTDEEVLVFADAQDETTPRLHGKGLLGTELAKGLTCLGEATGILLFEPGDHSLLRDATNWTIKFSTAKTRSEHEDITQRMMQKGAMTSVRFGKERVFMECDTPDEYQTLTREVYPSLTQKP